MAIVRVNYKGEIYTRRNAGIPGTWVNANGNAVSDKLALILDEQDATLPPPIVHRSSTFYWLSMVAAMIVTAPLGGIGGLIPYMAIVESGDGKGLDKKHEIANKYNVRMREAMQAGATIDELREVYRQYENEIS